MDWFASIDAYCERTGPELFNEPLNALSNAGFLLVAFWATRIARRNGADAAQWTLIALTAAIGLGSLAFHTFATPWAMVADVVPITLFIYGFLGFAMRRFFAADWLRTIAAVVALFGFTLLIQRFVPGELLNGSVAYFPALATALITAIAARVFGLASASQLSAASVVLSLSLVFRTADQALCGFVPFGTHFVWHLLNAAVLGLYLEAALRYGGRTSPEKN